MATGYYSDLNLKPTASIPGAGGGMNITWEWDPVTTGFAGAQGHRRTRDPFKNWSGKKLDLSRDWKTTWTNQLPNQWKDSTAATGAWTEAWQHGNIKAQNRSLGAKAYEVIDYGAYNKDVLYKDALTNTREGEWGKGFGSIQDILDAEAYMTGKWKSQLEPEPEPEPEAPPEPAWDHEAFESQYASEIADLQDQLSSFNAGDIPDLDTTLAQMEADIKEHVSSTYEGQLEDFKASDWLDNYVNKQGFASAEDMAEQGTATQQQIAALKSTLTGDITSQGADIAGLQADLTGVQGDVSQLTEDWSGVSSDVGVLKDQLSGYQDQLSGLDDTFTQGLTDVEGKLTSQFSDQISDVVADNKSWQDSWKAEQDAYSTKVQDQFDALESSTDDEIAAVRGDLGQDLSQATTDLRNELGTEIAGVEGLIGSEISDVESQIGAQGQEISQLGSDLLHTASGLQSNIDASASQLNERLSKLSSSMNYRMLGDSAMGVRMRQSRARKEGATRQGTGQLNRSMQISALNL